MPDSDYLLLADPIHLMYLANFFVDPFSLGGGFRGYLLLRRDGYTKLIHENRLPDSVNEAHVDERRVVPWYDAQSPAHGPRQLAPLRGRQPDRAGPADSRPRRRPLRPDRHPHAGRSAPPKGSR